MKKIYFPIICSLIFTSIIYLINLNQGQNDSHITRNLQFNSTNYENYFNQCQDTINTLFTSNLFYFKKEIYTNNSRESMYKNFYGNPEQRSTNDLQNNTNIYSYYLIPFLLLIIFTIMCM